MSEPAVLFPSTGVGVYEVWENLYQSALPETSEDWDQVWKLVDVAVSLGSRPQSLCPDLPTGRAHVAWNIEDGPVPDERTLRTLSWAVADWVEGGRRVLVHCGAGINRSGLLTALVVRLLTGQSGQAAAEHVRQRCPDALVSREFSGYLNGLPALEEESFPELEEEEKNEPPAAAVGS